MDKKDIQLMLEQQEKDNRFNTELRDLSTARKSNNRKKKKRKRK